MLQFLNRVNNKLSTEAYAALVDSCRTYMGHEVLWSQAKLQGTPFLNSPGKVQVACIKANHEKPFSSENEVNLFCMREMCAPLIKATRDALPDAVAEYPDFEEMVS